MGNAGVQEREKRRKIKEPIKVLTIAKDNRGGSDFMIPEIFNYGLFLQFVD